MYPVYCITPTGRTNHITQPISLDDNDCEWYLLRWEICLKNVQRICFFHPFHIYQCLHTDHGIFLLLHSNNVHHNVFVLRELHFCFMNGCLWWITFIKIWWHFLSHNGRSIFDILIDPYPNARPKNTPQVLWVRGKRYSNVISEKCHGSGQKDKYNPWYLKYKVLNYNWIFCTKAFNKTAKYIVEFSSRTFGRSPHFIKAIFSVYSFILFSCSVIYSIARILGYQLGLVRIPKYPDHRPIRRYPGKIIKEVIDIIFFKETTSKEK